MTLLSRDAPGRPPPALGMLFGMCAKCWGAAGITGGRFEEQQSGVQFPELSVSRRLHSMRHIKLCYGYVTLQGIFSEVVNASIYTSGSLFSDYIVYIVTSTPASCRNANYGVTMQHMNYSKGG